MSAFPNLPFINPGLTIFIVASIGLFQLIIATTFVLAGHRDAHA